MYVAHMTASPIKEYISNYARYIKYVLKHHTDKILFNHAITIQGVNHWFENHCTTIYMRCNMARFK